ncbi:MAG: hypothetical protein GYB53_18200 [Rhodobacteraceae bacterium]|nr:hypothetical protein [Paracoccaceae bacterium]
MSQSVIGALRVNLGLDSAQFEKGASRSQNKLKEMRTQFQAVAGIAAGMGAAIVAAALAGAKQIDAAAKASRRLDSSIGGFRALELAAGEAGVSLSGLANDIQTMNRELASVGTSGNGQRALDALGLSLSDIKDLDADEKLAVIADQVRSLGLNSGETTAILRDLGVRNREMSLLVLQGGDAIRAARGDIKDYGLEISAIDASRIEKANDQMGRLGMITQYAGEQLAVALVPAMGRMAEAMTNSLREGGLLRAMIDGLAGGLNEIAGIASVGAAVFATRYVGALVLAKAATFSFRGALIALRGALISTGIGALVVGAGILVGKFSELVVATGGFGAAMSLLKDVAVEVSGRIVTYFEGMKMRLKAAWMNIRATAVSSFAGIIEKVLEAVNKVVGAWAGAAKAVAAGWKTMPDVFKRLGAQAVNGLIDILSTGMQGVLAPINALREAVGKDPIKFSALDRFKLDVGDAVDVLGEVKGAFTEAFNADYINTSGIPDAMRGAADDLRANAEGTASYGRALQGLAGRPLTSVQALRDAMSAAKTEAESADAGVDGLGTALDGVAPGVETVDGLADALDDVGGNGGTGASGGKAGRATQAIEKMNDAVEDQNPLVEGLAREWEDFVGRGFKDFKGFASNVLDHFKKMLLQMIFTARSTSIPINVGFSGGGTLGGLVQSGGGGGGRLGGLGGGGGIFGSLGGIGSAFIGGLSNTIGAVFGAGGGLGMGLASIGGQIGAAIAAPTLTSIAGAIGAAAPVIGAVALAATALSKAFSRSYYGSGVRGSLGADGADVQSFDFYKGGAFKSSKTVYKPLEEEMQRMLDDTAIGLADTVRSMADTLGLASDAIDGFAGEAFTIWASGPHAETLEENLQAELDKLATGMADRVLTSDEFTRAGESSFDTLERLSSSLANVNGAFDLLGLQLKDVGLIGADAASSLVDLFGGLEGFTSSTAAYYQGFYSDAERTAKATELLSASLADLGIEALPRTRAAFRSLVDEANSLGDDELTAELIKLAPAFAEIVQGADALTSSLSDSPLYRTSADAAYAASADGYRATLEEIRTAEDTNDLLRDVVRAIQEGNINNARLSDKLYQETRRANLGVTS